MGELTDEQQAKLADLQSRENDLNYEELAEL